MVLQFDGFNALHHTLVSDQMTHLLQLHHHLNFLLKLMHHHRKVFLKLLQLKILGQINYLLAGTWTLMDICASRTRWLTFGRSELGVSLDIM